MYRTSNQSYGRFSRDSEEKNKQPSKENKRYNEISKLNHYQTPFQENYNGDYYSKHDYNTDRNQIVFNDLQRNYKQPEFNTGLKHYKEDTSYLNSHPILDTESSGLPNVGNTCYMNSILQCLFNTKKLFDYFINGDNLIEAPNSHIAEEFGNLLTTTFSKTSTNENVLNAVYRLKESIGEMSLTFNGYAQNDAHEFLQFLLDKMNKELNQAKSIDGKYLQFKVPPSLTSLEKIAEEWKLYSNKRENSIITKTFEGCLLSEITCEYCKNKSYTFENPFDLSLDLPTPKSFPLYGKSTSLSLFDCFNELIKEVSIPEFLCSKCKQKGKSKKKLMIWKQPPILIIHLKRFKYDKYGRLEALKHKISFPLSGLDLQAYTHKNSKEPKGKYKLYGVINHYGSLESGHYTSIIYSEEKDIWIHYNDSIKEEVKKREVEEFSQNSSEPYLLFYKKI